MTEFGIPSVRSAPSHPNAWGPSLTDWESVIVIASPRAINIIASVTMNAGSRNAATHTPEKNPHAPQAAIPANPQSSMPNVPASRAPARSRISTVDVTAARPIKLPTERSMPAVMITSVMPIAMIAMTDICWAMFSTFCGFKNAGQR